MRQSYNTQVKTKEALRLRHFLNPVRARTVHRQTSFRLSAILLATIALIAVCTASCLAQSTAIHDNTDSLAESYLSVGIGAFIPVHQSYSMNYATDVAGMPILLHGGVMLPITDRIAFDIDIDYLRRTANYVDGLSIDALAISPGLRVYLEPQHPNDFRVFALAHAIIQRTVIAATILATRDGDLPIATPTSLSSLPVGASIGLGLSYPLTSSSAIDGLAQSTSFFGQQTSEGGLNNLGGVTLILAYRHAL